MRNHAGTVIGGTADQVAYDHNLLTTFRDAPQAGLELIRRDDRGEINIRNSFLIAGKHSDSRRNARGVMSVSN